MTAKFCGCFETDAALVIDEPTENRWADAVALPIAYSLSPLSAMAFRNCSTIVRRLGVIRRPFA